MVSEMEGPEGATGSGSGSGVGSGSGSGSLAGSGAGSATATGSGAGSGSTTGSGSATTSAFASTCLGFTGRSALAPRRRFQGLSPGAFASPDRSSARSYSSLASTVT